MSKIASFISIGVVPPFATDEEKNRALAIRAQRRQQILKGGSLPVPATGPEQNLYASIREENKRLIASGKFGPSMNAQERERVVQVQRRQMIANGRVPSNATFAERAEAGKNAVRNTVVNIFRGVFRR